MNTLLAIALLGSLGSAGFDVDTSSTTIDYSQNSQALTLEGTDFLGGTLGGYFIIPQSWQYTQQLGLRASLAGDNPNSFFFVELYSGENLDLVGVYEGTTSQLGQTGQTGNIELQLLEQGPGNPADIRGMQFTWGGEGSPVLFSVYNFVDLNPPSPKITFYGFLPGGFTIRWTGTGVRPVNIQRSTNLASGNWTTIATGVVSGEYTDPSAPRPNAFYRVAVP
jgi:hypothetical protein